jgi:hypothetical protein
VLLCLFFCGGGGGAGADGDVRLAEAIVVTTAAAVAQAKSVNKTVPNKTAFDNTVGYVTQIHGLMHVN